MHGFERGRAEDNPTPCRRANNLREPCPLAFGQVWAKEFPLRFACRVIGKTHFLSVRFHVCIQLGSGQVTRSFATRFLRFGFSKYALVQAQQFPD